METLLLILVIIVATYSGLFACFLIYLLRHRLLRNRASNGPARTPRAAIVPSTCNQGGNGIARTCFQKIEMNILRYCPWIQPNGNLLDWLKLLLTTTAFIISWLANISFLWGHNRTICFWSLKLLSGLYVLCKFWLYLFLFVRGRVVNPFQRRTTLETGVLIVTLVGVPLFMGVVLLLVYGAPITDTQTDYSEVVCILIAPHQLPLLMLLLDASLSVAFLVIFVVALRTANAAHRQWRRVPTRPPAAGVGGSIDASVTLNSTAVLSCPRHSGSQASLPFLQLPHHRHRLSLVHVEHASLHPSEQASSSVMPATVPTGEISSSINLNPCSTQCVHERRLTILESMISIPTQQEQVQSNLLLPVITPLQEQQIDDISPMNSTEKTNVDHNDKENLMPLSKPEINTTILSPPVINVDSPTRLLGDCRPNHQIQTVAYKVQPTSLCKDVGCGSSAVLVEQSSSLSLTPFCEILPPTMMDSSTNRTCQQTLLAPLPIFRIESQDGPRSEASPKRVLSVLGTSLSTQRQHKCFLNERRAISSNNNTPLPPLLQHDGGHMCTLTPPVTISSNIQMQAHQHGIYRRLIKKHLLLSSIAVVVSMISMIVIYLESFVDVAHVLVMPCGLTDLMLNLVIFHFMTRSRPTHAHVRASVADLTVVNRTPLNAHRRSSVIHHGARSSSQSSQSSVLLSPLGKKESLSLDRRITLTKSAAVVLESKSLEVLRETDVVNIGNNQDNLATMDERQAVPPV